MAGNARAPARRRRSCARVLRDGAKCGGNPAGPRSWVPVHRLGGRGVGEPVWSMVLGGQDCVRPELTAPMLQLHRCLGGLGTRHVLVGDARRGWLMRRTWIAAETRPGTRRRLLTNDGRCTFPFAVITRLRRVTWFGTGLSGVSQLRRLLTLPASAMTKRRHIRGSVRTGNDDRLVPVTCCPLRTHVVSRLLGSGV